MLDNLVSVHNDGNEKGEDYVDEKTDETVEVDPAVDPDRESLLHRDGAESWKHIVSIDEGEQTFCSGG